MSWLSYLSVFATLAIFAGALGELIFRARTKPRSSLDIYLPGAAAFATLIFLPACLALPLDGILRNLVWSAALSLVVIYSTRPPALPALLWSPRFAFGILAVVMALILLWSLGNGVTALSLGLGSLAGMAGGGAFLRWLKMERF